jgi:hypothetical protein
MKLKYLAVLAAISLLSLTTACSTPSTTTPNNNVTGESKVDPCAGKKVSAASIGGALAKQLLRSKEMRSIVNIRQLS